MFINTIAFGQIPKINGAPGTTNVNGLNGYSVTFTVSGCPVGQYEYSASNAVGQSWDPLVEWNAAFSNGGSITTVPLGDDPNGVYLRDPKSVYVYNVKCQGGTTAATIRIHMISTVASYKPTIQVDSRTCSYADDPNSGGLNLRASGCFDAIVWTLPDGTALPSQDTDGILALTGNYQEGNYSAQCTFTSLGPDRNGNTIPAPTSAISVSRQSKEYFPPASVRVVSPQALGSGEWTEVCEGAPVLLNTNVSAANRDKFTYQLFNNGTIVGGNALNAFTTNRNGNYVIRVGSKGGVNVCGFTDSNNFNVNSISLIKPTILGNAKYCLGGTTTLRLDSLSYVKKEGYKGGNTAPVTFQWFVNGVLNPALGSVTSIKVNTNQTVAVQYVTNYNCTSAQSDVLTVSNYDRPVTPTITAKTKLGFCEGTPIAAQLESSDLPLGETTKYAWSDGQSTKIASINKAGDYTVKTINTDGCFSLASSAVSIIVLPLPAAPTIATVNGASPFFCVKSEAGTFNNVSLVATTTNDVIWSTKFEGKILANVTTSGNYTATSRDVNGCISVNSNIVKVVAQPNPALNADTKIVKEGVYTLKALNFSTVADGNGRAGDYEWKFGSTVLPSKTFITKVKTGGDYTVRRKYLYAIDGTPLTCITDAVKYAYVVDPEFSGVAVYPNPITADASNNLTVNIQILEDWTNADVMLYDMVGRPVYSGKIPTTESTNVLNVSGIGNGIYILHIKSADKSFVGKVIVNK